MWFSEASLADWQHRARIVSSKRLLPILATPTSIQQCAWLPVQACGYLVTIAIFMVKSLASVPCSISLFGLQPGIFIFVCNILSISLVIYYKGGSIFALKWLPKVGSSSVDFK